MGSQKRIGRFRKGAVESHEVYKVSLAFTSCVVTEVLGESSDSWWWAEKPDGSV